MASSVIKWQEGQVFKSTRHENEAFVITGKVAITKPKVSAKGKITTPGTIAYLVEYIPDTVVYDLPNGNKWVRERQPFNTNDDIIGREISAGNWSVVI